MHLFKKKIFNVIPNQIFAKCIIPLLFLNRRIQIKISSVKILLLYYCTTKNNKISEKSKKKSNIKPVVNFFKLFDVLMNSNK
jgi:hypothetical protein